MIGGVELKCIVCHLATHQRYYYPYLFELDFSYGKLGHWDNPWYRSHQRLQNKSYRHLDRVRAQAYLVTCLSVQIRARGGVR